MEMTTTTQVDINTSAGGAGLDNGASAATSAAPSGVVGHKMTPSNHLGGGGAAGVATQRAVDTIKRKKLKTRSATSTTSSSLPHSNTNKSSSNNGSVGGGGGGGGLNYSKDHLDAWLENCLRDATNAQLSSSSEFLDFNPTSNNKTIFALSQTQLQQQQQQAPQQQQQHLPLPLPAQQQKMPNSHNFQTAESYNQQQQAPQTAHQQQQQQQLQQHHQFLMRSQSQPYGMGGAGGVGSPFSLGIQRHAPAHSYTKHAQALSHRYPMLFPPLGGGDNGDGDGDVNGYVGYGLAHGDGTQDFASLPPLVNLLGGFGGSSEHGQNSTDVLDGSGSNPNISRGFRFSDPCLLNPSDNDSKLSGQNTPDRRIGSGNNNGNGNGNVNGSGDLEQQNKFFAALMEQINILHETNSKICRKLHDTKVDVEALKHAPNSQLWGGGMRHRRDSLSGLSTQSQPMVFGGGGGGGGFGTHSPAPTFHSGAYTPGMMTDVVREVKEAARVREDALLNRVKSMVEERQWSLNEGNVRILRDIDELKSHVLQLRLERKETSKRLTHLEAENKYLRQALASCYNNRQALPSQDIIYENERAQRTRKPFPNGGISARRAHSFNLHYGTVHQTTHSLDEDDEVEEQVVLEEQQQQQAATASTDDNAKRLSSSSNESRSNSQQPAPQPLQSPPTFALLSTAPAAAPAPPPLLPRKKEHAQLKRELSEAAAARKEDNQRIIALEKLVSDLSAAVATVATSASNNQPALTNGGRISDQAAPNSNSHNAPPISSSQHSATAAAGTSQPKFSVAGGPITDL